jgi:CRP-like cAMP-binding protein
MVIQIAGLGSMLGLSSAFFQAAFEVSAEAITEVTLKVVDRKGFLRYVKADSEIQARALQSLSRTYDSALLGASRSGGMKPASERIGNLLLVLGQQVGHIARGAEVAFPLLLTHEELGMMVAATRETVSRILTQFRKTGWISLDEGWVTIHHPENLRDPEFLQNNGGRGNSRVTQDFVTVNRVLAARESEMPLAAA